MALYYRVRKNPLDIHLLLIHCSTPCMLQMYSIMVCHSHVPSPHLYKYINPASSDFKVNIHPTAFFDQANEALLNKNTGRRKKKLEGNQF